MVALIPCPDEHNENARMLDIFPRFSSIRKLSEIWLFVQERAGGCKQAASMVKLA